MHHAQVEPVWISHFERIDLASCKGPVKPGLSAPPATLHFLITARDCPCQWAPYACVYSLELFWNKAKDPVCLSGNETEAQHNVRTRLDGRLAACHDGGNIARRHTTQDGWLPALAILGSLIVRWLGV
jgi:hypothetical protein